MSVPNLYKAGDNQSPGGGISSTNLNRTGYSSLFPHQQTTPDLTLYVESGIAYINGKVVRFAGGNSPTFSAPGSNNRIDLLVLSDAGALSIVQGVAAASPAVPDYPADKLVICEVYLRTSCTVINQYDAGSQGYIKEDARAFNNRMGMVLFVATAGEDIDGSTTPQACFVADDVTPNDASMTGQTSAGSGSGRSIYGVNWEAMTFQWPSTGETHITRVRLHLRKVNSPAGNVDVKIRATSAGLPTGADLTTASVSAASLGTSFAWVDFDFTDYGTMTGGTTYAIVISTPSGDATNRVEWQYTTGAPYGSGQICASSNSGSSWGAVGGNDYLFEVFGRDNFTAGRIYKSDSDRPGRRKFHGFVISNTTSGNTAVLQQKGKVSGLSGMNAGKTEYISTTPGALTESAPSTGIVEVGIALNATELLIDDDDDPTYIGSASLPASSSSTSPSTTCAAPIQAQRAIINASVNGSVSAQFQCQLVKGTITNVTIGYPASNASGDLFSCVFDWTSNTITITGDLPSTGSGTINGTAYFFNK